MKFAQHLTAHITPEWHKQYIRYEFLKDFIYTAAKNAPPVDESSVNDRQRYFREQDEEFFRLCTLELTKIESFFCEKLAEANRKFAELTADLTDLQTAGELPFSAEDIETQLTEATKASKPLRRPTLRTALQSSKLKDLKLAFSEFYLSLVLLQNYQQLNVEGIRKTQKKHDKVFDVTSGAAWRDTVAYEKSFRKNHDVDSLIHKVESLFTNVLERGDRGRAMKRLRVPPLSARHSVWVTFRVGMLAGIFLVLLLCVALLGAFAPLGALSMETHTAAWRVFRGTLLLIVFVALCGANAYGWSKAGVNHVLIFETDPRSHLTSLQLVEIALLLVVLWLSALILYLVASAQMVHMSAYIVPFALLVSLFTIVFVPLPYFYMTSRKWLMRKLGRCCAAPFLRVKFADFWLADQLNSLVLAVVDLQFAVCFFTINFDWLTDVFQPVSSTYNTNTTIANWSSSIVDSTHRCSRVTYGVTPFISAFPALIRFLQCCRRYHDSPVKWHLLNAGKYSTTFLVVACSTLYRQFPHFKLLLALWLVTGIISATYGYLWDIKMDWGLFDKHAPRDKRFLRSETVYGSCSYYYVAIVEDLVIRFAWLGNVLVAVLDVQSEWQKELVRTAVAFAEALRRCIWNFFRLENEHLNNCGQYRAVRDISIAPVTDRDYSMLENIMDSELDLDKVCNERKANRREQSRRERDRQQIAATGTGTGTEQPQEQPRRRLTSLLNPFARKKTTQDSAQEALVADDNQLQDFWSQLQVESASESTDDAHSRVA